MDYFFISEYAPIAIRKNGNMSKFLDIISNSSIANMLPNPIKNQPQIGLWHLRQATPLLDC